MPASSARSLRGGEASDRQAGSASGRATRRHAQAVVGDVLRELDKEGLRPRHSKRQIITSGARKIVLGLMVDGAQPRLTREYRNKLRLHAHMLGARALAPSAHAQALKFRFILSMQRHIEGKIAHARRVEPDFADMIRGACTGKLDTLTHA